MRVHELAAELSMESRELLRVCHRLEILVKGPTSVLDEDEVASLKEELSSKTKAEEVVEPAEETAAPEESAPAEVESEGEEKVEPAAEPAEQVATDEADAEDEDEDRQPTEEELARGYRGRGRGRRRNLSEEDPYWQFGTPVEYWGSSRGDAQSGNRDPSGLSPEDPYWQFGSPPDTWGSSRKQADQPRHARPRVYIECRTCGVKIEKKRAHRDKKTKCPFCNRWMREVK